MSVLVSALADVLKALLPQFLAFLWEKAHESTTVEDAAGTGGTAPADVESDARRGRLLADIRRAGGSGSGGGGGSGGGAPAADDGPGPVGR